MKATQRRLAWIVAILFGLVLIGVGALFLTLGLSKADQAGSVIGAITGVVGLAVAVVSVILARHAPPGAQRVDNVESGADVDVIDGVAGSIRLGAQGLASSPTSVNASRPAGEQSVANTKATGSIRIVRGVDGNLDINP